jgi:hypothetical protein
LVLAPGASPQAIRLSFPNAQARMGPDGDLTVNEQLRLHKPLAYQEVNGTKRVIASRYVLQGKNQVGFELGEYDRGRLLVIDPVMVYTAVIAGAWTSANDSRRTITASAIATDSQGNTYMTGTTSEADFPVTPGAPQGAFRTGVCSRVVALGGVRLNVPCTDAFVAKLNPSGTTLIWSTYLGGSEMDEGHGIALDSAGNVYVAGYTMSSDFPATARVGSSASPRGFVAKLNPQGTALLYSTYIDPAGARLAVDRAGNAHIASTVSSQMYTTPGAFQPRFRGKTDAYVLKLNAQGTALSSKIAVL